ncbi:hypothetical protein SISNIDRAFT_491993 [Sistotremastrum niveocremeum HHB9708]|uniref:Uncharacterized protein n=1 Tax=Sistotremastrum niveocremeum HHB9708 TaxID=1314777 RepID=A0A164M5Z2_9AGAM|nr:hypothetical protein SISNIDRAFT_491993 [Sistotremastrum niveocremeum HHB9708]
MAENAHAMWEYDPGVPGSKVLNGSLDVISAIRTLAVKIQASGQRIQAFHKDQIESGINPPLQIPLHSNIRWGTALRMLLRAYDLRDAIDLFICAADKRFGPITTIRVNGRITKTIPWTAFTFKKSDWNRVRELTLILQDADCNRLKCDSATDVLT